MSKAVESIQRSDIDDVGSGVVGQVKEAISDALNVIEEADGKRKVEEQLEWIFGGNGISKIDAQTVNGSISLDGSDRDRVIVRAWKEILGENATDVTDFAQNVRAYTEQIKDEIQIYREYPKPPKGINVNVRYEILSPCQIDVSLRTVNNGFRISRTDGTIDGATVNSAIKLQSDTGPIRVHTTNGGIEATIGL